MTEYVVKLAFWLRAWDSVTIEAKADAGQRVEVNTALAGAG
jgi:hypothetical protein